MVRNVASVFVVVGLGLAGAVVAQDPPVFVGSQACKKCHIKQFRSWEQTRMAQAFELLRPGVRSEAKIAAGVDPEADYTTEPTCVVCHVTGYGRPGGFVSEAETPELLGIGCETCHGPGGTYLQDGYMTRENKSYVKAELVAVGLVDTVGPAQCTTCHNQASPFVAGPFDFEAVADEGTHEHVPLRYDHSGGGS